MIDNFDLFDAYERKRYKKNRPECAECGEPIQDDYGYRVAGELYCASCIENMIEYMEDDE